MIYVFPIAIPANTPSTAPVKTILGLTAGKIIGVQVQFPPGHNGLTHIGLNRGLHQLYPSNPEAQFSSSNETISWIEDLPLDTAPYQLEAYAWNDDTTFPHTITVRINMQSPEEETSFLEQVKQLFS